MLAKQLKPLPTPLPQRHREVLELLIADYIATALPVGSQSVARRHPQRLSSATIRKIMADLSDLGLITQPHTSAGRVPSQSGMQYYVDTLLTTHELGEAEREQIRSRCEQGNSGDVGQFLRKTSSVLSAMSQYMGLVLTPAAEEIAFKHIEFLPLSRGRLLGIFVAQNGLVQNRIIQVDEEFTYSQLERINTYCSRAFVGLSVEEARKKISAEVQRARAEYDRLLQQALEFSDQLLQSVPSENVMLDGELQLMQYSGFARVEQLTELTTALEEKQRILALLERCRESDGVKIFIGAESGFSQASIVSAPYRKGGHVVGMLGVIGPQHMDYARVASIVDFTAKLVSDYLRL